MTAETVLNNARIVLADEIVEGSLVLRDGLIAGIEAGAGVVARDKAVAQHERTLDEFVGKYDAGVGQNGFGGHFR
jgi:hypothetical protein